LKVVYPVADIEKAKRFFREIIGNDPYVDSAQYVGYKTADDLEIGLTPSRDGSATSAIPYWTVDDIAASVKALEAAGGAIAHPITDVGYGLQVASVKDANGAIVGLRQFPKSPG